MKLIERIRFNLVANGLSNKCPRCRRKLTEHAWNKYVSCSCGYYDKEVKK